MVKKTIILNSLIILCFLPVRAQVKSPDKTLKREITLYNPFKPALSETKKKSVLPEMNDTIKVRRDFRYDVKTEPFLPVYNISPIKAAALLPDPLPRLYKSFINIGMGNYTTPLAELSITNERSKKGTIGFYARHLSSNGKVELQNSKKVFAGYQDNDASLFGRKFFKSTLFESSVDFSQRTRYAYGYDPAINDYSPPPKDVSLNYYNAGANVSLTSQRLDSADLFYKFGIHYNFFYNARYLYQHNAGSDGIIAKSIKGFYAGLGISYDYYRLDNTIMPDSKYIFSVNPFISKSNARWNFRLGVKAVTDKNMTTDFVFHVYPDLSLGFNVVPSYINFFAALSGKLEKNQPLKMVNENPFLIPQGSLFTLQNTSHDLIILTGFKGNTGLSGTYLLSASYSLISDMIFFTNLLSTKVALKYGNGNYFVPLTVDGELLNIHGEAAGRVNDKISYKTDINYYKYTVSLAGGPWNMPDWDLNLGLRYNLRDKILAGVDLTAIGKRKQVVNGEPVILLNSFPDLDPTVVISAPVHFNLNLSAEYRYSKILSFWTRINNISTSTYYEWAYYPSQKLLFMLGFTYSL